MRGEEPVRIEHTERPGGVARLETALFLARPPAEVFPFFADARNLGAITPPWLDFRILGTPPAELRAGSEIRYRIRLHGVPIGWRTRITLWDPGRAFVDEQVRGPYRFWRHRHDFEEVPGGTCCRDRVDFVVPGPAVLRRRFVRPRLERIFRWRARRLAEILGRPEDAGLSMKCPEDY